MSGDLGRTINVDDLPKEGLCFCADLAKEGLVDLSPTPFAKRNLPKSPASGVSIAADLLCITLCTKQNQYYTQCREIHSKMKVVKKKKKKCVNGGFLKKKTGDGSIGSGDFCFKKVYLMVELLKIEGRKGKGGKGGGYIFFLVGFNFFSVRFFF